MATDPNKALLNDSMTIERRRNDYALSRKQRAKVFDGQYVNGYRLSVENGRVNAVQPPAVPAAPTNVVATAAYASASVAFTPQVHQEGDLPITGYTVTSSPGGVTATGSSSPINVPGLTNGTTYTFTVKATNSVGQSAASPASNPVTPSGSE